MEERRVREREKGVERNKVKERKWGKMRRRGRSGWSWSPTGRALGKSKARWPGLWALKLGGLAGVLAPPDRGTSLELFPSHLSHIPLQLESFHGVLPPSPSGISLREP
ncbi:hypothetical protein AAG906_007769 [Vitis piasezkii]